METPPNQQRAITPATAVRLTLRDQLLLMGTIVSITTAAGLWAFTVQRDIADLKREQSRQGVTMETIVDALGVHRFGPPAPAQQ